jgi:hypothetical protein
MMNDWFYKRMAACLFPFVLGFCASPAAIDIREGGECDFGKHIQRTMGLLASSTPEHPNEVNILFYGQSIMQQGYVEDHVIQKLQSDYPHAVIHWENKAIGGYEAPSLVRTADADLYPFHPDLVVFHVYGGETGAFEEIMVRIRKRTTAEVLTWTHHLQPRDFTNASFRDNREVASDLRRSMETKYGIEVVDVREVWGRYLEDSGLSAQDLLNDTIHPNIAGGDLMGSIISPHFVFRPEVRPVLSNYVETIPVERLGSRDTGLTEFERSGWRTSGSHLIGRKEDGVLSFSFVGNRVDLYPGQFKGTTGTAGIRINGRPPSAIKELYAATRTSPAPQVWWPTIKRIGIGDSPVEEEWTLTVTGTNSAQDVFEFSLRGSVTGFDGSGRSDQDFVSESGRILIEADDWHLAFALSYRNQSLPANFTVTWRVYPQTPDTFQLEAGQGVFNAPAYRIIKGLPSSRHYIEIIPLDDNPVPIAAIIVHRPPLDPSWVQPLPKPALIRPVDGAERLRNSVRLRWDAAGNVSGYEYEISSSIDFSMRAASGETRGLSASISGLSENASYYWRVRSTGIGNYSDWTEPFQFTVGEFNAWDNSLVSSEELEVIPFPCVMRKFTARFQVNPGSVNTAGRFGILGEAGDMGGEPPWVCVVELNGQGAIRALNGTLFSSDLPVHYKADEVLDFMFEVDPVDGRYDVYLMLDAGRRTQLACGYLSAQQSDLNRGVSRFGMVSTEGSFKLKDLVVTPFPEGPEAAFSADFHGSELTLDFYATEGKTFQMQGSVSPVESGWVNIGPSITGTGRSEQFTVIVDDYPEWLFRVLVLD